MIAVAGLVLMGADLGPWPRVVRYVAKVSDTLGPICYALVTEARGGVPSALLNLGRTDPTLCSDRDDAPEPAARLGTALAVAETIWRRGDVAPSAVESLSADELPTRLLSPVSIPRQAIDAHHKVVIGAGLNYAEHRDEVGARTAAGERDELLLFPKPVAPTGAYAPVATGIRIASEPPQPVWAMDYEVELGVVLLEDIALDQPLPNGDAWLESIAFVAANDVSDREPIYRDSKYGFAQGKSHPGYLPLGPWIVHGKFMGPMIVGEQPSGLRLELHVNETDGQRTLRQNDRTTSLLHGPREIVTAIAERYRRGHTLCMRNAHGEPRYLHNGSGVIPAGSLVLTGTPGGTVARAPGILEKLFLVVTAGFSVDEARRRYIERARAERRVRGFLEPAESVESWVEHLGRQRWSIVAPTPLEPYGVAARGECEGP